uniref:LRAT domain-containing protein n=2 Tax=Timspurckia oligopyrenoides TaxID=708627 RepID=A0A7S1EQX8_9RHOD|mmetsp:Transcript_13184/g.23697  ORF Transcript_13184/g.23697 Transcript_13184/m.23697 type:complete len:181 (+) Transcript_13184:178-720(+)
MARGDHLMVWRGSKEEDSAVGFWHHGIDCGDGTVIHYIGIDGVKSMTNGSIGRTCFEEFQFDSPRIHVVQYNESEVLPVEQVIQRAESRIGHNEYNLLRDNCESFSRWCKTGQETSYQSLGFAVGIGIALAAVLGGTPPVASFICGIIAFKAWDRSHNRSSHRIAPEGKQIPQITYNDHK